MTQQTTLFGSLAFLSAILMTIRRSNFEDWLHQTARALILLEHLHECRGMQHQIFRNLENVLK